MCRIVERNESSESQSLYVPETNSYDSPGPPILHGTYLSIRSARAHMFAAIALERYAHSTYRSTGWYAATGTPYRYVQTANMLSADLA